jgi:hypothetical protein
MQAILSTERELLTDKIRSRTAKVGIIGTKLPRPASRHGIRNSRISGHRPALKVEELNAGRSYIQDVPNCALRPYAISQTNGTTLGDQYRLSFDLAAPDACGECDYTNYGANVTAYALVGLPEGGSATPEPTTLLPIGGGLVASGLARRRKKKSTTPLEGETGLALGSRPRFYRPAQQAVAVVPFPYDQIRPPDRREGQTQTTICWG